MSPCLCLPHSGRSTDNAKRGTLVFAPGLHSSASDPYRPRPAFAHAIVPISADQAESPGQSCLKNLSSMRGEMRPVRYFCVCSVYVLVRYCNIEKKSFSIPLVGPFVMFLKVVHIIGRWD